ncbi:MAG: tRNA (adenosine(37)-N6)-threonylcarbamoyltransferase complex dimerization subunit type 1 TsaB [Candidatus Omnitrophica bacterium]|jgi:tRNA threonylcarbamoyladenosine biosynthesis protein TsaB|nr:tRNA (adenosine(37)-N6)-threonylcarbamoyltransferase complex dimerization subunit type 1 TsaB [Candidatus Omnitrophota bacterium]
MKNILAIDISSSNLSVCLARNGTVVFDFNRQLKFAASRLPSVIKKSLEKAGSPLEDIDTFIIGSGPGSFTGLRVSFSIFKAFMISLRKEFYSLSSFYSCAWPYRRKYEEIAVIADAKKDLIYFSCFRSKNGLLQKTGSEKLVSLEELPQNKDDYLFITYDLYLREKILNLFPKIRFLEKAVYPQARYLIEAVKTLKISKVTKVSELKPLYLHPETCQIKKL